MKAMILTLGLAAALASAACVHGQAVAQASGNTPPVTQPAKAAATAPATLLDSDQFIVHSAVANADYLIQVARPIVMAPPAPGEKWPVIYALDGTYMVGAMAPLVRLLPFEGKSQAAYIVGIGFPEEAFMAYGARRQRELLHVDQKSQSGAVTPGGGAALERFIREELRPMIEARYPVDRAQSVLAGHSMGGLFTTTVLANDPTAFAGYMIGSPSLQFDPTLPERVRAAAAKGGGRRVSIASGDSEGSPAAAAKMVAGADALEAALKSPGSGFVVARKTFADESHVSVQGAWMSHGVRYVLPPAPPPQKATP